MLRLPPRFAGIILAFAPLFVHRSWRHAQNLLVGAILTPGQRTVTSVVRIMGRAQERRFVNVHRILKPRPTFADALATVRCAIWRERTLATSPCRRA
ncbi:hypothetical protein [Methylobacterium pseudosasicola]|uniref:Uncharacterized protein n=1 Tax=Methylobacterium pseudosasicola TaxID=582667 RepID=A0A1I4R8I6_9HYPH|nr:hypothetical protein [Methylobacterium pseudosasicola]SFM48612.1 hypothetical protein SAMN05192568_10348 [Methylobacterium pseudosasicola]